MNNQDYIFQDIEKDNNFDPPYKGTEYKLSSVCFVNSEHKERDYTFVKNIYTNIGVIDIICVVCQRTNRSESKTFHTQTSVYLDNPKRPDGSINIELRDVSFNYFSTIHNMFQQDTYRSESYNDDMVSIRRGRNGQGS